MRKLFSFCAAMFAALALNAAVINITPTSPQAADNLRLALNSAADGDEIVMAEGTYVESNGNYIAFAGKHVTVRAAEGANVLIQPQVPVQVTEGGIAHFVGVKFDASRLNELATWYEHLIYPADANEQNKIVLEDCEFYGFNINKSMLYCSSSNKLNAITINRCYFHNIMKSVLFIESTAGTDVLVANSTFANIETTTGSYYAGVLDSRATAGSFSVNFCTFYNVQVMNTDYAAVGKVSTPGAVVANSIFMMPTAVDGVRAIRDVANATNCITFNYLKDSGTGIHSSVAKTNCLQVDPAFTDPDNNFFALASNSPALTMNDGAPIGDPRWWPVIGAPEYYLVGSMNNWTPDSAYKFTANPANEDEYMLTTTLAAGDSIKVLGRVGAVQEWFPDQAPNYVVDAAHAGEKTIYFQTTYKADWAEFGGYFWMEANPAPAQGYAEKALADIVATDNVIVTMAKGGKVYAMSNDKGTGNPPVAVAVTVANNQIEKDTINILWHIVKDGDNFSFIPVDKDTLKLYCTNTNNGVRVGKNSNNVFSIKDAYLYNNATSRYLGVYNEADWRCYTSINSNITGQTLKFYAKAGAEPAPEVKYSLKNNWGAGEEWTWKEMTKDGNNYKLENVVFGGTGVNYKSDLLGAPELWVPVADFLGDVIEAKDTVTLVYNPADTTITATLVGKYEPEPVPGCNWNELEWIGGPAEYANQFKVCKAGEQPGVVNIQKPGFAREYGIYMTFPSAAFGEITVDTSKYDVQGAGIVFHLSAFSAKVTDVAVVCDNTPILFSVYNVNGIEPEVKYSLKNNWDASEEWTWKEMTKDGDNYKLENVVFGGTGVNYKSDLLGAPEIWVPMANFLGDTIGAKDTVIFVLNPADSTITVTLLGKYIEPTPVIPMALYKAVAATDTAAGAIYVDNEYMKIQTVYKGTIVEHSANIFDETFTHAIQVRVNDWPTAAVPAGTQHANGTPLVITAKKSAPFILYYVRQAIDKKWTENDNKDVILFDQAAPTTKLVAASMVEDSVLVDSSYYYIGKAFELVEGHTYTLAAKGTTIKLLGFKYPENPAPVHTYTVAGAPATLFGQEWAPSYAANDMEHLVGSEYLYIWAKDSVTLPAGNIQFKICEDHAWTHAWPSQNYVLPIAESGIYNIAIYFNPLAEADSLRIRATADKVGEAVVIPAVKMHGNFTGSWADTKEFTLAADSLTASLKLNLAEGSFEFGMKFDGTWKANGANITRTENTACLATGDGNMHIAADQEGEYTFTYTFETQTLAVTYPKLIQHYNVAEAIAAGLQDNDLVYVRGIVTKMEFKGTNFAKYGSVNIYVADATGAEGEFEFYNCYSLNADTFRTSDPAYDATSTAWAQFQAVTDGNGKTVHVGDMVEAYGKYKLYNTTHELNTGCYLTLIEEPAPSIIYDVKMFNRDWSVDTISTVTWDGINEKVMINIIPGKSDAWQGQVWLKLPMDVKKDKEYDLTFKIKANKTFGGSIVKYQENAEMLFDNQLALTADVETIYESKNMPGVLAAGDVTGNGVLCMSFGYCPDSTLIEMYAISIVEHDPTTVPAKFYVTGNDAFTVDAGLTTADSWNVKAFKSEADTMTFALKAGAEYQIKLSVDGTWNTAMGYNDLTEVTPGIIDADGNNHNIGFSLVEDGDVMVIYTAGVPNNIFKVVGNFVTQGLNDIDASVKAVKVLRNGQIFIIRGDKVYTVTGQPVK